ncbi:hypothetical protein BKA65DRAFT_578228 [Rhexocercosporidium sp. MPI-PUGE-AT-0058]|nr:hypothetical protein BKA65DRAFT_578228 [Rhexocercosporidium sp. MPI-PUGE-AT-0058]
MAPKVALKATTIMNRLGETAVLSAFLSDKHFITILPGGELIRHTAVITKFLVEFNSDLSLSDTFYGPDESLELPLGSVIVLRVVEEEQLVLDVYTNNPEAPPDSPTASVALRPVGEPETKIDTSLAKTHAESDTIIAKLFKIFNDPSGNPFPGAALKALINGPGKGLGDTSPAQPDKFDMLVNQLMGGSSTPSAQVANGTMPKPPAILVKLADGSPEDVGQKYQAAVSLQAVSALFENMLRVQKMAKEGRSTPYSITDPKQACLAIQENADLAYNVAISGLSGYYITTGQTTNSYSKDVNSSDFKLEFTSDLFKPFNLTSAALDEISGVLQQYIQAIGSIKLDSTSTNKEITHFIRTTMISKRNVSGDDSNPSWVWQPETKLLYMHIDTQAYFNATSSCIGHSETESFHYKMEYTVYEADIDIDQVVKNQDMLDKTFQSLTQQNMAAFAKMPGISTEVDPGDDGDDNGL